MTTKKQPTLKDVARHAGVSTGTVSLVLNRSTLVAVATRVRVMKSIEELGYIYNRGAAQLRSRKTNIVALAACNLTNPYFASIAAEIENSLEGLGYALLIGNCAESVDKQRKFLENIREYNVDGVMIIPARSTSKEDLGNCAEWSIPLVMVSRYVPGAPFDYAGSNNKAGATAATRHLIDLGHKRIAFVGWNRKTTSGRDRAAGYRAAMRNAGFAVSPELTVECGDSREEGFRAIHALYQLPDPPTAVVCFNDVLAFGVMLGLRALDLVPGKDCSVIGYDDVAEAVLWRPPLTTVKIDVKGIGAAAAGLMKSRFSDPNQKPRRVTLHPTLSIRETCSPPARPSGKRMSSVSQRRSA